MKAKNKKLYAYVDESGRDPFASFFIVGIVLADEKREDLSGQLLEIEKQSGKGINKWQKTNNKTRQRYIEFISSESLLVSSLFYVKYYEGKDYLVYTADAIARTLKGRKAKQVIVFIDGFRKSELNEIKRQLRPSVKIKIVVKTIMREESDPVIRLADAICGLVRDADEGIEWTKKATAKLKRRDYLREK